MKKRYIFIGIIILLILLYVWDNSQFSLREEKRIIYSVLSETGNKFMVKDITYDKSSKVMAYGLKQRSKITNEDYYEVVGAFNKYIEKISDYHDWKIELYYIYSGQYVVLRITNYDDMSGINYGELKCFWAYDAPFGMLSSLEVFYDMDIAILYIPYKEYVDDVSILGKFPDLEYIYLGQEEYLNEADREYIKKNLPNCTLQSRKLPLVKSFLYTN